MPDPSLTPQEQRKLRQDAARDAAIMDLGTFIRAMWSIVEPTVPFEPNWHVDAVCWELARVSRGEVDRLTINIPPGSMKSLAVSVFWPAWERIHKPGDRSIYLTHGEGLSRRDARRYRTLINSERYKEMVARYIRNLVRRLKTFSPEQRREFRKTPYPKGMGAYKRLVPNTDGMDEDEAVKTLDAFASRDRDGAPARNKNRASGGKEASEPLIWTIPRDQDQLLNLGTSLAGMRAAQPLGAAITGKRGDKIVIDDPYDAKDVIQGSAETIANRMRATVDDVDKAVSTRVNDPRHGGHAFVLIMQRLHPDDLAGVELRRTKAAATAREAGEPTPEHARGYERARAVVLPMRAVDPHTLHTKRDAPPPYEWDPRWSEDPHDPHIGKDVVARALEGKVKDAFGRERPIAEAPTFYLDYDGPRGAGALLFPGRFPEYVVDQLEARLQEQASAQLQQNPAPTKGSMFDGPLKNARVYHDDPVALATAMNLTLVVDATFGSKSKTASEVGLVLLGRLAPTATSPLAQTLRAKDVYLLHAESARMTFLEMLPRIVALRTGWPRVTTTLIEAKANGPVLIEVMQEQFTGVSPFDPRGTKEERAAVPALHMKVGDLLVPAGRFDDRSVRRNERAPWWWGADGMQEQIATFPKGRKDDLVDCLSSGTIWFNSLEGIGGAALDPTGGWGFLIGEERPRAHARERSPERREVSTRDKEGFNRAVANALRGPWPF
tara:strand:- start:5604 stop:7769 length:2166 start_codon:yes stop_codon:yes gene_type:complete